MLLGIVLLVCSALFSYLLNEILLRYSRNLRENEADPKMVRWAGSKPTIGGISFYITFILSAIVSMLVFGIGPEERPEILALISVVTLGFLIGLQDDAYNTRPMLKLMGQISCAAIIIVFGYHIDLGDSLWGSAYLMTGIEWFLTIFWVVGVMNSINMLDNMDGVTATVSLMIVSMTVLRIYVFPGSPDSMNPYLLPLIATAGAFIGFLMLNWHPSRIYMGDTGSQFLGAFLAFIGIRFFWNFGFPVSEGANDFYHTAIRFVMPVMIFMVPIMDTSFVTISRIMRGQSPFVGGKDHLTHSLSYLGVQQQFVPVVLGLVSATSGLLVIFGLYALPELTPWHIVAFLVYVGTSFGIFFFLYSKGERHRNARERFARTYQRAMEERKERRSLQSAGKARQHS